MKSSTCSRRMCSGAATLDVRQQRASLVEEVVTLLSHRYAEHRLIVSRSPTTRHSTEHAVIEQMFQGRHGTLQVRMPQPQQ